MALMAGANPAWGVAQLGHFTEMFFNLYSRWIAEADNRRELSKLESMIGNSGTFCNICFKKKKKAFRPQDLQAFLMLASILFPDSIFTNRCRPPAHGRQCLGKTQLGQANRIRQPFQHQRNAGKHLGQECPAARPAGYTRHTPANRVAGVVAWA